jgi:SAM-dependent methyltransferase
MAGSCYDHPQYWDLAFRDETRLEADFVDAVAARYCDGPVKTVLEPGCGGGRLVVELASRGYDVTGFDLSAPCISYLKRRLKRRGLKATVFQDDMITHRLDTPVDLAICPMNTFRHLLSEGDAKSHLESIAGGLRNGGIYMLGLHLLPPDIDPESTERWSARHASTRVVFSLKVLDSNRRKRIETIRFRLSVTTGDPPQRQMRYQDDFPLRMYTAAQFRRLLKSVPAFQLLDVYDFWYDIDDPLKLDNTITDTVFVLRKR